MYPANRTPIWQKVGEGKKEEAKEGRVNHTPDYSTTRG
jgi:hypothetical protein